MEPISDFIHSWDVNGFNVRLLGNHNSLMYETVDTITGELIHKDSFDEYLKTTSREKIVSYLKMCRIMIDNGVVTFSDSHYTANLRNKEINLIKGTEDLFWDIFCTSTKLSSFFSLKNSTVPSPRCHPETVALIEKLKNESFQNRETLKTLIHDFKVVRRLDDETYKDIHEESIQKDVDERSQFAYIASRITAGGFILNAISQGAEDITLLSTTHKTLAYTLAFMNSYFSTAISAFTANTVKTVALSRPVIMGATMLIYICSDLALKKYNENIQKKIRTIIPQKPILIEIEPKITAPSIIDPRVVVSKFTWAVTLITYKGSFGNHSEIVIEGINDGFYTNQSCLLGNAEVVATEEKFIHLSCFLPRIESGLISSEDLKYETRTEIWMIACCKIKKMLQNIEAEKQLPRGQRFEYNMCGEGIVDGFKAHNCFTWAQFHLKPLGIEFNKKTQRSISGLVAHAATDYTKKPESYTECPIQRI